MNTPCYNIVYILKPTNLNFRFQFIDRTWEYKYIAKKFFCILIEPLIFRRSKNTHSLNNCMAFFTDTETKVILLRNMRKILRYDVKRGVEGET